MDDTIHFKKNGDSISFAFYHYTSEEVLADTNGYEFYIKKLNQKYEQMKENGTLTKQDETYFTLKIKQSELEQVGQAMLDKIRKFYYKIACYLLIIALFKNFLSIDRTFSDTNSANRTF